MSGLSRPAKRHGVADTQTIARLQEQVTNLRNILERMLTPTRPQGGFFMRTVQSSEYAAERQRMIDYLWKGAYEDAVSEILEANPDLESYMATRTGGMEAQQHLPPPGEARHAASARLRTRSNFLAGLLARVRSKYIVPKHQLLLSIEAEHKQVPLRFWDMLSTVRVLLSHNWTEGLIEEALRCWPGPSYPSLEYVSMAAFDNFTEQLNYDATHTADTQGLRIDMTNWATIFLPADSAPGYNFAAQPGVSLLAQTFKAGFDKYSVAELCMPDHADIVAARDARWDCAFGDGGIEAGTFFSRPLYLPPCQHSAFYQDPIPGRLQSSYEDVEAELDEMREHAMHKHSNWVFVGGDGLAIMRLNHTLARKYFKYLDTAPVVIPVQGEHPHGTCHVLHMGWRPYWPLLQGLVGAANHKECSGDELSSHPH